MENEILQVQTVAVNKEDEEVPAIMIAVNMGDPDTADDFIKDIAETVKMQRMVSPPETNLLLVTVIGDIDADEFADTWQAIVEADPAIQTFMTMMEAADVIVGTRDGQIMGQASLLPELPE